MDNKEKLFVFKVVAKKADSEKGDKGEGKWVAREGVAAAGCTDSRFGPRVSDTSTFC